MPVQLTILSGSKTGESVYLDKDAFRVGDDPTGEVYLDPRHDPAGRGRLASVSRHESGWRIQNLGGGPLLVNHTIVDGQMQLRSGDIIRLSDMGPDLRFNLASDAKTSAVFAAVAADPVTESRAARPMTAEFGGSVPRRDAILRWCAVTAAVLALLGVVTNGRRSPLTSSNKPQSHAIETTNGSATSAGEHALPVEEPNAAPTIAPHADVVIEPETSGTQSVAVEVTDSHASPGPVAALEPWKSVAAAIAPAVCLLVVETPQKSNSFPCGTACGIRDDALLTDGIVAAELQNKRLNGWQVKAFWPSDGQEMAVGEILVHKAFNATADVPNDRIYWELAIVRLKGKRDAVVPVAEPNELAGIEAGLPLACAAITHRGLPRTRFDNHRVELSMTEVYLQTCLTGGDGGPHSGAPTLLHLTGTLPKNIFGSPVVNEAGNIVGVYAEKSQFSWGDAGPGLELHYAPLIMLARAWLAGQSLEDWTEPECPNNAIPTDSRP